MRSAIRTLLRDPSYLTVVVLTLAFGIAVNTIMFAIVRGVLLSPLRWQNPGQLVLVNEIVPEVASAYRLLPVNSRHYFEWRDRSVSFAALGILDRRQFVLTRVGDPEQVIGARISANFLGMRGVQPQLGRDFVEQEDQPGHDHVAVISDSLWTRKFHRDPGLVGRSIILDGVSRTVIGILAPSFDASRSEGLSRKADVFVPAAFQRDAAGWLGEFNYAVIGRLKAGVSLERALAELNVIQVSIATHFTEKVHLRAALTPLQDEVVGPVRRGLLMLFGAVGVVLFIVCVNLANLSLARVAGRRRDLAIRNALGAGRGQLVRSILSESLSVAIVGGAAGIALAALGLEALLHYAPGGLPRIEEIRLDAGVFLFAAALSILAGLLVGILPAWRAASADPQESLRESGRTATETRRGLRTRDLLVGVECALSTVLLVAAGLLIGSFVRLLNVDKGFDASRLIAIEVNLPASAYSDAKQREPYYRALVARLQTLPGVIKAGLISRLPLEGRDWGDFIRKSGDHRPTWRQTSGDYRFCSPAYFQTMGIPLVAGMAFTEADRDRNPALISESAARAVWPGESPIGRKFDRGQDDEAPFEVFGVVRDVPVGIADKPVPTVYVPYWYRSRAAMSAVVRTSLDPRSLAVSIRSAVHGLDPDTVVGEVRTMQNVVSDSVAQRRFQMWLITAFAVSALLLASIGIYGVVSWSVSRRRNEIGIRMALGARGVDVHRMVMAQAMRPVFGGLLVGVAGALAMGRLLTSLLFGVSAHDPATIFAVMAVLSGVAAMACYVPSRRAAHGDPLEAIRHD